MPAIELWKKMLGMIFETGHPWITFKDPCNVRSPQDHVGVIHSSNLCTEITLNTSAEETAVCNLGSVVLDSHLKADGSIDHAMLRETVTVAVRALDNVIDINFYPTKAAEVSNLRHRPVGMGVMGLQDCLYRRDISFASDAAVEFNDEIMEAVAYYAYETSSDLAAERGTYSTYKGSKWDRGLLPQDTVDLLEQERGEPIEVKRGGLMDWAPVRAKIAKHGMRNSNVLAIAPTATISNIVGSSPCIEPTYKNLFVKSNLSGEFTELNGYLVRDLKKLGLWSQEMMQQVAVEFGELAGEVALHEEVLVGRLDARRAADDVRDRGGRGDGEHVGVAHAMLGDLGADRSPVHETATLDLDRFAAFLLEQVNGVLRKQAAVPLGALVSAVGTAFGGEVGGGLVGVVGHGFHDLVVELDGGVGGEGDVATVEAILETHHAHADRTVAEVGDLGGLGRVEVDVDDVIEGADGDRDGLTEHRMVDAAIGLEVRVEDDGAQIADGGLLGTRVERDLGAEIGGVDDADVILRGADVAGVLEGDPRVAGLEDHPEHLLPEFDGRHLLAEDLTLLSTSLVSDVALLEIGAEGLVQVRSLVGKGRASSSGGS